MYGWYMHEHDGGRGEAEPGHYELRDHPSIGGLVNIVWCPDGQPASVMVTIGAGRLGPLAYALDRYIARNPVARR
jgi:hypothetical protein